MAGIGVDRVREIEERIEALKRELTEARRAVQRETVDDHVLHRTDGAEVRLSELFGDRRDLLVVHNMGKSCPYCTLWADGFVSHYRHYANRCAFVLCSGDDWQTAAEFASSRGWNFPVVSGSNSVFAREMGFQTEKGEWWPGVSAFHLEDDGSITRTGWSHFGPGDDYCPVWPMFDLLENGADGWEPKYTY